MGKVGDLSITLKASKKNKHFRIISSGDTPSTYSIGQQTFDHLDELVKHYKKHLQTRAPSTPSLTTLKNP